MTKIHEAIVGTSRTLSRFSVLITMQPMNTQPIKLPLAMPLTEAIAVMGHQHDHHAEHDHEQSATASTPRRSSCALILDDDKRLVGILTERDIVRLIAKQTSLERLSVADVMTKGVITLDPIDVDSPFIALSKFRKYRIRHLPVVDVQGVVHGLVTPYDIRKSMKYSDFLKLRKIEEVMSDAVVSAHLQENILELAELMATHRVSCVVIVEKRTSPISGLYPVGIVTERDIVQLQSTDLNLIDIQARQVMSTPLTCMTVQDELWTAHQTMQKLQVHRLVVTDRLGHLAGIVTQTSILTMLDPVELQNVITLLQEQVGQLQQQQVEKDQALFRERELAQVTLHAIADAVITVNMDGIIEYFNPVAEQLTGWTAAEANGKLVTQVFRIVDDATGHLIENPIPIILKTHNLRQKDASETVSSSPTIMIPPNTTTLLSRNGAEYGIEEAASPICDRDGTIIGAVIVFHDVTQSRQMTRKLSWQASHDPLTQLPNRLHFEEALRVALEESSTEDHRRSVLFFLDLDQFKLVNDTCGHAAGDELLRQVSSLLKQHIRSSDVLARLGGDEFGILLHQCPFNKAEAIAETLRLAIQNFCFIWQKNTFNIGVSIGLVALSMHSFSLSEALSAADSACYAAKNQGRNRVRVYQVNDVELVKHQCEQQWSIRIKHALENNQFCLHHQAIYAADQTQHPHPIYYEVLLRMIDEQGQLVSPGTFIPAAERFDLMPAIDRWVIQTFFETLDQWQLTQSSSIKCSVAGYDPPQECLPVPHFINLSGASLGDREFLSFLEAQFDYYQFSPQTIGFEITETAAITNLKQAHALIQKCKALGCRFALDDFGSGMSSFGYLKQLPVDYLKIDGHFIKDILTDSTTLAIVQSINHIGHVMGLKTIAEFVENQDSLETLKQLGVDYVQGYGIARPQQMEWN